jgi:leucyl aminopeptidase
MSPGELDEPLTPAIDIATSALTAVEAPLLGVGYTGSAGDYVLANGSTDVLQSLGLDAFAVLDRDEATGAAGSTSLHRLFSGPVQQVALIGLGNETGPNYRRAGAALSRLAKSFEEVASTIGAAADDEQLAAFCEGWVLGAFVFSRKSDDDATTPPRLVLTGCDTSRATVIEPATVKALASWRSRTFALTPSNEKNPELLEEWSREAAAHGELDVDVWDEPLLADEGMRGILAVGAGSAYDSRFVRLSYQPRVGEVSTPSVVLVGKGITFDSGGISIKPRDAMMTMKRDMTGAGVVIAVMRALRELDVQVRVTGLVAAAENAFGGGSMRPGDVVTHYGGRSSEIANTDAEGRLVLADGLAYADLNLNPDVVVDIATLTGAGKVALGTSFGALFSNDDQLADQLTDAGAASGEPVWRLPLSTEYESLLESPFADATNAAGGPGAITAALFLQHFAGNRRWAHLDIASVGDSAVDEFEYSKGATGFGARLLLTWLCALAAEQPGDAT